MLAHPIIKCSKPLAANASAAPLDVVKMKSALGALGLYEAPEWGVSQFPDAALFDAIKAFQKSQGLKVDGAIKPDGETEAALSQAMTPRRAQTALQATAQALQSLGRGGDELLAHITPEEAALLHRVTDGGSINPQTGLLEFRFDASADHKSNQNDNSSTNGSSDGHGRGQGSGQNDYEYEAYNSTPSGPTGKKDGFGDSGNGAKGEGANGQSTDGNASGGLTGTKEKEDNARGQSDNTRTRRASAKEDTLPGDILGGDGLSKKDDKENNNPPGYDPDETIEDVEKQLAEQLGPQKSNKPNEADKGTKIVQKTLESIAKKAATKSLARQTRRAMPASPMAGRLNVAKPAGPPIGVGGRTSFRTQNPYELMNQGRNLLDSVPFRDSYLRTGKPSTPPSLGGGGGKADFRSVKERLGDLLY